MDFVGLNGKQSFEFSFHSPLHWFDWVANPSIKLAAFLLFAHPSGRNFRRRQKTPLFQRDIQSLSSSSAASLSFVSAFYNIWLGHAMIVFYGGTWLSVHANLWLTLTKSNSLPSIYNSKYLSCRCSSDHNPPRRPFALLPFDEVHFYPDFDCEAILIYKELQSSVSIFEKLQMCTLFSDFYSDVLNCRISQKRVYLISGTPEEFWWKLPRIQLNPRTFSFSSLAPQSVHINTEVLGVSKVHQHIWF